MKIKEALQALVPSIETCESIAEARRASIRRAVGQPPIAHCVSCDVTPQTFTEVQGGGNE